MSINYTIFGQAITFALFVLFCMKYVWPLITEVMRERQKAIAEGLEKASQAERQLEQANDAAAIELEAAKVKGAELIAQADKRAKQIIEEAKDKATEEGERLKIAAQAEIEQEMNRAREELRAQIGVLAISGAEKILESSVDIKVHQQMLDKLAAEL